MTTFESQLEKYVAPLRLCMIDGTKQEKSMSIWSNLRQMLCDARKSRATKKDLYQKECGAWRLGAEKLGSRGMENLVT